MIQALKMHFLRWRINRLRRKAMQSDNATIAALHKEMAAMSVRHALAVDNLRERLEESEAYRDAEEKEYRRRDEQQQHEIDRLNRQLELAELENRNLAAINARDLARVEQETAMFERRAMGLVKAFEGGE